MDQQRRASEEELENYFAGRGWKIIQSLTTNRSEQQKED